MCQCILYKLLLVVLLRLSLSLVPSNGRVEIGHEVPFSERLWQSETMKTLKSLFRNILALLRNRLSFCAAVSFEFWKEKEDNSSSTDSPVLNSQKFLWSEFEFCKCFEISLRFTYRASPRINLPCSREPHLHW